MKNVLILSHDYYNQSLVSTVRPRGLVKFLPKYGWRPIVLCADQDDQPEQVGVHCATYIDRISKLKGLMGKPQDEYYFKAATEQRRPNYAELSMRFVSDLMLFPESEYPWKKAALPLARKIIKQEEVDGIISTSFPATSHIIASTLKREFDIKWIADYRDPWSGNSYFMHNDLIEGMLKKYEKMILRNVDKITSVSSYISSDLSKLLNRPCETITNGFDPTNYGKENFNPGNKLVITHTGNLYFGKRDPEPFLHAVKELLDSGRICQDAIEIRFIGCSEKWLHDMIDGIGLAHVTRVQGKVSREEALRLQRESNILLLLTRNDPSEIGVYTGKIFDYLAMRRPILSYGYTEGVLKDLMIKTRCGYHTSSVNELSKALVSLNSRFQGDHAFHCNRNENEVMKFSQERMAQKFAELLDA